MKIQISNDRNEFNRDERLPGRTSYEPIWERLPEALQRVMATTGATTEDSKRDICRALADRAIKIRCQLNRHLTKHMTSKAVLDGSAFQIPPSIEPSDMDWKISRPTKPWQVERGAYSLPGFWHLAWLELSKPDVTALLCGNQRLSQAHSPNLGKDHRKSAADVETNQSPGPERRRGRRPKKLPATIEAMRQEFVAGTLAAAALSDMAEKTLADRYSVSRDTARKARDTVLSELNSRQLPTNDK